MQGCIHWLLLGLLPGFEPRYAAPLLLRCMGAPGVFLAAAEAAALAAALAAVADRLWGLLLSAAAALPPLRVLVARLESARRSAGRMVERYELLGLALFVAAPVPVTGIYTGAVAAALLGLPRRRAAAALAAGGVASVLATSLAAGGAGRLLG